MIKNDKKAWWLVEHPVCLIFDIQTPGILYEPAVEPKISCAGFLFVKCYLTFLKNHPCEWHFPTKTRQCVVYR